jgi:predicted DNA-binding transcriptional regulator AlpA
MHEPLFQPTSSPEDSLVDVKAVRVFTTLSRARIYELIAAGDFPVPVHVGRRRLFSRREVMAWIADRLAARKSRFIGGRK